MPSRHKRRKMLSKKGARNWKLAKENKYYSRGDEFCKKLDSVTKCRLNVSKFPVNQKYIKKMPPRRRHGLELGLILLLNELLQFGMRNIPPVTLCVILGQAFLYMDVINVPWEKEDVCISGNSVLLDREWKRLILCAFEHGDDMHLYYNMASLLLKGRTLEKKFGSKNFGLILLFLIAITNIMYVVLAIILSDVTNNESYMKTCAIGFSGVVFALKVLTTHEEPSLKAIMVGIQIPGKCTAWIELLLIHLLVPNSSFMGHLAGILAGIIYCNTFVGKQLDKIFYFLTGQKIIHGPKKPTVTFQTRSTRSSKESHSSTLK